MSGISGWIDFQRDLTSQRQTIEAMGDTLASRGPDSAGTWVRPHAALAHRGLAVVDLPGGTQPMEYETPDGPVALVYSGATYNFTELRDELRRRGHQFHTDGDAEVILHGYLEWGAAIAEQLNGMCAFAIWDSRSEKLLLVRDRMGIKPLYYYPTENGVLFGSEPKAIFANPLAERVMDADGLREIFAMVKTPGEALWAGMREVLPGTVVTVDRTGLHQHTYWRLEATEHIDDQQATVAHVRELLDDIVNRQLVADVPRGVLLSGGLDSSAVTALSAEQLRGHGKQIRSFAVDFVGQSENFVPDQMRATPDGPYVHDVAEYVQSLHQDIMLDPSMLADPSVRRKAVAARDLPMGLGELDNSLYLLFKAIREHSTVALSGESADELFGGYQWFHDPQVQQANEFPWLAALRSQRANSTEILRPDIAEKLELSTFVADSYQQAVSDVPRLSGESDLESRMRVISYLHLTRFLRLLLDRMDRMSMAVGLEARVPLSDHRLVEYVFNAPWALKTFDGREKSLLRHATADTLPQSVVDRVKSPYPSTQDPQYAAALRDQVAQLESQDDPVLSLLNRDVLRESLRADPAQMSQGSRQTFERVLDMSVWYDLYKPTIRV